MAKKLQVVSNSWAIRFSFQSLAGLLVVILVVGAVYLTGEGGQFLEDDGDHQAAPPHTDDDTAATSHCNLFSGKWVFDNGKSYYREKECRFMSDQLACEKFGRQDLSFQNWRWKPHSCDLPRFNATALLERLRNKRLVFVGDSLNRNQWVSMVCLVDSFIPPGLKSMHTNGSLITFMSTEHNASIEFYWAPLLVESNSDDPVRHRLADRIIRAHAIEKHARHWTHADILVFNSYLWWRAPNLMVTWGSFENPEGLISKEVEMLRSYEMALQTWSDWLEINVNRTKTQLFFMSMSPTHERGEEWGGATGQNCYNETEPIFKEGYGGSGSDPKMMHIVEMAIGGLKRRGLNVKMLNITQLTEYRKDGHPSIYRKQWEALTEEQLSNPTSYADCIHWCLPGVPDVWNELLYAYILHNIDKKEEETEI
ncbi:Protein trichome birefringence-like 34 [Sarracenia purpurea var. burkii]